jgi:hypothetical protein
MEQPAGRKLQEVGWALDDLARSEDITKGELDRIEVVRLFCRKGLAAFRRRRYKGLVEIYQLVADFIELGAKAVVRENARREGDFLTNQLKAEWSESVIARLCEKAGLVPVQLGPSAAAMPGEREFREDTAAFREIYLVEGKRPDLAVFLQPAWDRLATPAQEACRSWPKRVLQAADDPLLHAAYSVAEVKVSTWHYAARRAAGGGYLNVAVKDEELAGLRRFVERFRTPLLFFQVLFDQVYCMSFRRMSEAMERGHMYIEGDYELQRQRNADDKWVHYFRIDDETPPQSTHRCGAVRWPNPVGHARRLPTGQVAIYTELRGADAELEDGDVVQRELEYENANTNLPPP